MKKYYIVTWYSISKKAYEMQTFFNLEDADTFFDECAESQDKTDVYMTKRTPNV